MSNEEEYSEEEYEEEEEEEEEEQAPVAVEEAPAAEPHPEPTTPTAISAPKTDAAPKLRPAPKKQESTQAAEVSEAEQAMIAARQRHEQEEAARLQDYEQRRVTEREQAEQELAELRARQAERRKQREADEQEFNQRRQADDQRRRAEEEERKSRIEQERARREEEKLKRQQMMAGAFVGGGGANSGKVGRNFVVQKKEGGAPAGTITSEGKRGRTEAEIAEAKQNYMASVNRPADVGKLLPNDIKAQIKRLHARIVKLEGEKYDLEQRHARQDYDLKELSGRERQVARKKAQSRGLDVEEAASSPHPPKITVSSKFDRQTDRRSYQDRRTNYENPYVKPKPSIARGTARPPPEWGLKKTSELDQLRQIVGAPKYHEQVTVEGARPPVTPIPLQLPSSDFADDAAQQQAEPAAEPVAAAKPAAAEPKPPAKPKRATRA